MKKIFAFFTVIILMFSLTACNEMDYSLQEKEEPYIVNQNGNDYVFEIGEPIELTHTENGQWMGTIEFKNAIIIEDDPAEVQLASGGTYVADAVIQINYAYEVNDPDFKIGRANFESYDNTGNKARVIAGNEGYEVVYTKYQHQLVAVKSVGDYVDLSIEFGNCKPSAFIRLYYGVGEIEEDEKTNDMLWFLLAALGVSIIVVTVKYILTFKKRQKAAMELRSISDDGPEEFHSTGSFAVKIEPTPEQKSSEPVNTETDGAVPENLEKEGEE